MKKVSEAGSTRLPIALLYLDDIEELYQIISTENPRGFRIIIGGHQLDSLGELDQLRERLRKERVRSFEISADEPRVAIRQELGSATITYDGQSTIARGIESRLREKWIECKRKIDRFTGWGTVLMILFMTWSAGASGTTMLIVPVIAFMTAFAVAPMESLITNLASTIVLARRNSTQGFWRANREKILLMVMGSLVTLAITSVGLYIRRKFF